MTAHDWPREAWPFGALDGQQPCCQSLAAMPINHTPTTVDVVVAAATVVPASNRLFCSYHNARWGVGGGDDAGTATQCGGRAGGIETGT